LGNLLALYVTPGNEQDRAQVEEPARQVHEVTQQSVEVAFVDQGYTGDEPAQAAQNQGMELQVIELPKAKKGFVLLPRR
jgi:transposase